MISLGIGGFWDADAIEFMHLHLLGPLFQNTPLAINILKNKTDDEIALFFCFLFDGPHPENYQSEFEGLHTSVEGINPRVAALMKKAYAHLLAQEHCPGH